MLYCEGLSMTGLRNCPDEFGIEGEEKLKVSGRDL